RQGARVGAGLVRVVGEFLNRSAQVFRWRQIQFRMISFVLLYRAMDVFRFVKAAPAKRNGESLQLRGGSLCGVVENRGRINPATEPNAQRNVRDQMLS